MRTVTLLAPFVLLLAVDLAPAEEHHPSPTTHRDSPLAAPYAGSQKRAIKALSVSDTADLRAGRGMGLALAAELNGYPGPLHVLELAERLELSAEQRSKTAALLHEMKAEAKALGELVIDAEAELDRWFKAPPGTSTR